jgi:hypothetical protein
MRRMADLVFGINSTVLQIRAGNGSEMTGIVNGLLGIRFLLKLLGANPASGFVSFIYNATRPLVAWFAGSIRTDTSGLGTIEWFTLLAIVVYWLIAWALVRLFTMSRPAVRY